MNTIQITTADGTVNYTEAEVLRFIERAKEVDAVQQVSDMQRKEKVNNRNKVRDFFSEGEWNDGETVVSKGDVNELLESIGANKLTTRYNASYTITGTFTVEVEDEDDVESLFADNVDVSFHDGDIDVDQIEVNDIEATE
jgi:DNA mismatch repair ATPase MutS